LSEMFPIKNGLKQGDVLSHLLFNFVYEFPIRRDQVNQDGLKLNVKHQLLVHAEDVNKFGRSVHTLQKTTEAVAIASKETGLEVNFIKTMYKVMSLDQNAGQSQNKILIIVPSKGWSNSDVWEQP